MPKMKSEEQPTALRRSSRSTRGSVKPVIDLTKSELSDQEEDKNNDKIKKEVEVDEDVQVYDLSDDEDFEEPSSKSNRSARSKRQTKATSSSKKKQPAATKEDKKLKKGNAQIKAEPKTKSTRNKSTKNSEDQEKVEEDNQDEVEIYYQLSEKEMKEVNNAFNINCSQEQEELLTNEGLRTAIRSLGFEPRADEIQKLMKKFSNENGKLNRENFQKIMALKMGGALGANDNVLNDEISKVFNLLDLDKTGMITFNNLKSISKELNEEITDEELNEMIAEADLDGDFQINKQEFYNIMKKTSLY